MTEQTTTAATADFLQSMTVEQNEQLSAEQRAVEKAENQTQRGKGKGAKKETAQNGAVRDDLSVGVNSYPITENSAPESDCEGFGAAQEAAKIMSVVEELKAEEGKALPTEKPEDEKSQKALLHDITERLKELVIKDKGNWMRQYQLMAEVREKQLYKTMKNNYGDKFSFKKWVSYLAETLGFNVSLLWARLDAGESLDGFVRRVQAQEDAKLNYEQNSEAAIQEKLQMIKVAPDNICFARRIARGNTAVFDDLMNKLITGELKRSDLKIALEKVKKENAVARRIKKAEKREKEIQKKLAAVAAGKATLTDEENKSIAVERKQLTDQLAVDRKEQAAINAQHKAEEESKASASAIVQQFQNTGSTWIPGTITAIGSEDDLECFWLDHGDDLRKYKVFAEFAVRTAGTSHYARRIDALILENYSVRKHELGYQFTTHAIEIKVSVSDYLNDKKLDEYREFTDFAWLAIPKGDEKLLAAVKENLPDSWGILVVRMGGSWYKSITVEREATRNKNNLKRDVVYATAIQKLLSA